MSLGFKFQLAGEAEDGALRAVLRQAHMPGSISLAFSREPSFFIAERAGSVRHQTLIYQDQKNRKIAGIGGRSIRKLYVDGKEKTVGYLSSLRLLPEVRSSMTLVRGYSFLRSLHGDGEVPYYFTTILNENRYAQQILESGRVGMPIYVPVGMFVTYLISIRKKVSRKLRHEVLSCSKDTLPQAHMCLSEWNGRHQFAPAYTLDDLSGGTGTLPNFSPKDLYVCKERGEVVGTFGVWDQQSFKQTIVTDYSARMKEVRPFYNGIARLRGHPTLPSVGESIRSVYASFVSSKDDNTEVFESLIDKACSDWSGRGHDYLLVGFSEGHKLASVVRRLATRELRSRIYLVHWPEEKVILPQNGGVAHIEVATL
jgi:hypothetical protein